MASTGHLKDGRSWEIENINGEPGVKTLKRDYIVKLDGGAPLGANGEFITVSGVPKIGDAHPTHTELVVKKVSYKEGAGAAKNTVVATVTYERPDGESQDIGGEDDPILVAVEQWGWDASTGEVELTEAKDGTPVLNSAGDPFDSVPKVQVPTPVFTKVFKTTDRHSGVMDFNCLTNATELTIGDLTCDIGTLLCTVAEARLFNDADGWNYRYTVTLRYKSQMVRLGGDAAAEREEIGWDCAVVDTGMRAWNTDTGKKELIRIISQETGKPSTVTSPALLNGSGEPLVAQSATDVPTPYVFRFKAYDSATFPAEFYSEPPLPTPPNGGDED